MADETEFRETLKELNLLHCPFEKTILNNHFKCQHSHRHLLAGREIAGCKYDIAQYACKATLQQFRSTACFSLRIRATGKLPHGKAVRIQVGGLRGLIVALENTSGHTPPDCIYSLIKVALEEYKHPSDYPPEPILQNIAQFKGRKKHRD